MRKMSTNGVNADGVEHQPDAILSRMEIELRAAGAAGIEAWPQIRVAASSIPSSPPAAIILTGCGDSYYAALGLRGLVELAAGIPVVVQPAMEAVSFPSVLADPAALLVGISVSGKVERTIEAVAEHSRRGGRTASISAHADSDLAQAADAAIPTGLRGTPGPVPGTANYLGSLLGLVALAAELAERRGASLAAIEGVPSALQALSDLVEQSGDLASAEATVLQPPFFILGSGPDYGTAWFGVPSSSRPPRLWAWRRTSRNGRMNSSSPPVRGRRCSFMPRPREYMSGRVASPVQLQRSTVA